MARRRALVRSSPAWLQRLLGRYGSPRNVGATRHCRRARCAPRSASSRPPRRMRRCVSCGACRDRPPSSLSPMPSRGGKRGTPRSAIFTSTGRSTPPDRYRERGPSSRCARCRTVVGDRTLDDRGICLHCVEVETRLAEGQRRQAAGRQRQERIDAQQRHAQLKAKQRTIRGRIMLWFRTRH